MFDTASLHSQQSRIRSEIKHNNALLAFSGGAMLTKFVGVFRELASFNELLHTQVELLLVERLHRTWRKVMSTAMITGIMVQYICYAF